MSIAEDSVSYKDSADAVLALAQVMRKAAARICGSEHGVTITGGARRALLGDRARYVE